MARTRPIAHASGDGHAGGMEHTRAARLHIREWPADERPREKLLARGSAALSDAELLALFLGSGVAGEDAVASARRLLTDHGPLRRLLERDARGLARLRGIGPARACVLLAALELGHRHVAAELARGEVLADCNSAGRFFVQRLRGQPREVFSALFLDTRHRMVACEDLFFGTIDGAEVHPREVVRRALAHNAASVIVAHNHPSGSSEPSQADRAVTVRLRQALQLVDVRLLDHVVIGDGAPVSMAARGLV